MDFEDTPQEAKFRAEVRAFLAAHAERRKPGTAEGYRTSQSAPGAIERAKAWQAKKYAAGFAGITWPKEWGGRGGTPIEQVIYNQEEAHYVVPRGFSEPAAGSDLAGLRTRAERQGDDWVINGQKIWTSGAHYSDYGILVARSDPAVPKHKGLTFFFLGMKSPGIDIRPIRQISGHSHFNEVFFSDLRIPDSQRLGPVGAGWQVSLTTLMNERLAVGDAPGPDFSEIFELARSLELADGRAIDNAAVRDKLADWYVKTQGLKYTKFRTMTALSRGQTPGPEASI